MSDALINQTPPHDADAERCVLSCMLYLPDETIPAVEEQAASADFYDSAHRAMFDAMTGMAHAGGVVEPVALAAELRQHGLYEKAGGGEAIVDLADVCVPSRASAVHYARIVRNLSMRRAAIQAAAHVISRGHESQCDGFVLLSDTIGAMQETLTRIEPGSTVPAEKGVEAASEMLDRQQQFRDRKVWTHYSDLDRILRGLLPGHLVIVGSRPGHGKSTMLLNLCRRNAKRGIACLMFSLEMERGELWRNILLAESKTTVENLESPDETTNGAAWAKFSEAQGRAAQWPLWIDDRPRMGLRHIAATGLRYVRNHGVRFVCIDYAQLMDTTGGKTFSREQEVAGISRGAKLLARQLGVPVLLAAQINRAPDLRDDHRPRVSDLRESGGLENDADVVMLLWRPELYLDGKDQAAERQYKGQMEAIIAKHRGGRTGTACLDFAGASYRIEESAWRPTI